MVWIAVAGVVAVIGVIVWSFRRDKRGADEPGGRSGWDWESRLGEDARVAFMEGVRACQDQAGPLAVNEERGLLRIVDPPRLISSTCSPTGSPRAARTGCTTRRASYASW